MAFPIPNSVKRIWNDWNLRGIVLVSLFFQIVLIVTAPSRKRTGRRIVTLMIWAAYLLADWVAAFAVGLISKGQGNDRDKNRVNEDLAAFWAPFLLLHLGGPDTITAFSLEDNELWIRHLLGLVIQLAAVAYVFSQSVSKEFWIPTVLMFFAGTIKYAERTRALYLACLGNFKVSMLPAPEVRVGPNYAQFMEEYSSNSAAHVPVKIVVGNELDKASKTMDDEDLQIKPIDEIEVVENGYKFFTTFKGLIVDLIFSFHERRESRKFFFQRNHKDAFRVMEVELNFMYDALYTKMAVVHSKIGYFFRVTCSVLIAVSFYLFASLHKHKLHRLDIAVTYTLLVGAVVLDFIAHIKLIFSDWTIVMLKNSAMLKKSKAVQIVSAIRERLSFDKRGRWSKSVSQHSLINYCLPKWFEKAADFFGLLDLLDEMKYKESKSVKDDLKNFIFNELREKAKEARDPKVAKEICSARGDWILSQYLCPYPLISASVSEKVEYDESLLLWHIATELCYFTDKKTKGQTGELNEGGDHEQHEGETHDKNREFCKLLSEYMLYLLVMRPTMMLAVSGIGQIRFQDTCVEAKKFFRSRGQSKLKSPGLWLALKDILFIFYPNIYKGFKNFLHKRQLESEGKRKEACKDLLEVDTVVNPIYVKGDRSKSLLFDACMLAKELNKMQNKGKKWEIMSKVWVELLSYAATHIKADAHAQQLSKGGELITFVWLLMAHFGLGDKFRNRERTSKLIVSK